jgi:hypothetical protein
LGRFTRNRALPPPDRTSDEVVERYAGIRLSLELRRQEEPSMTLNEKAPAKRAARARTRSVRGGLMGIAAAALAAVTQLWSGAAHAQRGEAYALREDLSVRPSPDRGFPGVFDTELVRKGAFVANLPLGSMYYGLTRDLSVGTILWSYLPLASGMPGGSVHARYLLGSTSWFRSTADVLVLGAKTKRDSGEGNRSTLLSMLGSNTEFALDPSNRLVASAWLGHLNLQNVEDMDVGVTALLFGGTYSLTLARWAALHLTGMYLASGTANAGLAGLGADFDWSGAISPSDRLIARGTLSLRAGSWLFNLGAIKLGSGAIPWVNVAFEVGG